MMRICLSALLLVLLMPAVCLARTEGGCLQKHLATVIQSSKMMVRCYGMASRQGVAVDEACIERADRRLRISFQRLAQGGCPQSPDPEKVSAETIAFMEKMVDTLGAIATPTTRPVSTPGPATP